MDPAVAADRLLRAAAARPEAVDWLGLEWDAADWAAYTADYELVVAAALAAEAAARPPL